MFPLKKKITPQTKLWSCYGIDIDGIRNIVNLHRLTLINERYRNLKVIVDGGQVSRNKTERGSQKFYKPIDVQYVTNAIDDIEVSMIFLVVTFALWVGSK